MSSTALEHGVFHPRPAIQPGAEDMQRLAHLLNDADRITIFGGAGCVGAHGEVLQLAKQLQAPIAFSFRGKEFLEFDNPYAVGMTGLLGTESGHFALEKAELILMLGTGFPYTAWYPKKARMVQIDVRAEHLGRRCKLELG
jgi:pyruvate dehydrogenase (quinone)